MSDNLGVVGNYRGMVPFLIEAAKKKGMRFDVSDFPDGDVECLNEHVVIFRRTGYEFVHRLFESDKCGIAAEPVRNRCDLREIERRRTQKRLKTFTKIVGVYFFVSFG